MYLCSGGENFILWKDAGLATALANLGYRKMDPPKLAILPPVRGFHQDYTALANAVRNASDSEFLLMTADIDRANTQGPGVRLESPTDVSYHRQAYIDTTLTLYKAKQGVRRGHEAQVIGLQERHRGKPGSAFVVVS